MASYNLAVWGSFILVLFFLQQIHGLKCYKCSSLLDANCKLDWDLSSQDSAKYKVECPQPAKACQKIVGEIQASGVQHVYRFCWNMTTTEVHVPTGCEIDEIRGGAVCRCTSDYCNLAQRHLSVKSTTFIAMLLFAELLKVNQYFSSAC